MEEKEKKEKRERTLWNEELIRKVIAEEGITNTKVLREKHYGAYQYINKNGLSFEDFGVERYRKEQLYTVEQINAVIRDNHLRSFRGLRRISTSMYMYVYNNNLQDRLEWPFGKRYSSHTVGERKKREKRYDIWKVMHLLRRYAKEEGISLRDSAVKYGYFYEWYDLVREGTAPTEE